MRVKFDSIQKTQRTDGAGCAAGDKAVRGWHRHTGDIMCGMLGTCSCLQDGPVRETETETASCFYLSGAETARSVWYLLVTRAAAIVVTVDWLIS